MGLTVTSVVATSGAIDELGHFGAAQVMGKLAATTVCREAHRIAPAGLLRHPLTERSDERRAHYGNVFLVPAALSIWATGLPGTTHTRVGHNGL